MAIPPVEKICPRCQTRFFGRKNKVFCSETCKVDANNEKLKQVYHAQRGTSPKLANKRDNTNYTNRLNTNNTNHSHKENELLAQNQKLQQEIQELKQAVKALTAPTAKANIPTLKKTKPKAKASSKPARKTTMPMQKTVPIQSREEKLKAAKVKAEEQRKRLLELEAKHIPTPQRLAQAEREAKEILKLWDKEEEDNIQNHPEIVKAREESIASIRKSMEDAKKKFTGKKLAEFLREAERTIAEIKADAKK